MKKCHGLRAVLDAFREVSCTSEEELTIDNRTNDALVDSLDALDLISTLEDKGIEVSGDAREVLMDGRYTIKEFYLRCCTVHED